MSLGTLFKRQLGPEILGDLVLSAAEPARPLVVGAAVSGVSMVAALAANHIGLSPEIALGAGAAAAAAAVVGGAYDRLVAAVVERLGGRAGGEPSRERPPAWDPGLYEPGREAPGPEPER